jgi:hypothetical protein
MPKMPLLMVVKLNWSVRLKPYLDRYSKNQFFSYEKNEENA